MQNFVQISVALAVTISLLVTTYFLLLPKQPTKILLIGASQTGKTVLFYRLKSNIVPKTVISTIVTKCLMNGYEIIDTPGHSRFVFFINPLLPAKKIFCLIDGHVEYLYDFMARNYRLLRKSRIVLVFTKSKGSIDDLVKDAEIKM
jgi:GTPase SAR1 family protein